MVDNQPLDLAEIDPPRWRIMIDDVVYGPYTLGQMRSFVAETRLQASSKVADGDGGAFVDAHEHEDLGPLFGSGTAKSSTTQDQPAANHMIFIHHVGASRAATLETLNALGQFAEMMPGGYLLSSAERTSTIRLKLAEVSEPGDQIIVVNASNGRLAWAGLGDETDALVRSVWKPKT